MAQTALGICNLALGRIGVREEVGDFEEDTQEASACARFYPHARDVVLESFDWRFASRRVVVTPLVGVTAEGWTYVFQPPADMLVPREAVSLEPEYPHIGESDIPSELAQGRAYATYSSPLAAAVVTAQGRFELVAGPAGPRIASNLESLPLRYTARIENPAFYPPSFVDAVTWYLAADLALVLPVKPQLEVQCRQRFQAALAQARTLGLAVGGGRMEDPQGASVLAREGF